MRAPFEPMAVPTTFLSNTNAYRHQYGNDPEAFTRALLEEAEEAICFADPDHVAMLIAEPCVGPKTPGPCSGSRPDATLRVPGRVNAAMSETASANGRWTGPAAR